MVSIPLIGVAAALVAYAVIAKVFAEGPRKASKFEKAEIMRQLLALSEPEKSVTGNASTVRLRSPLPSQGVRSSTGPRTKSQRTFPSSRPKN